MRALIISHEHPALSKGGGGIAAYALYQQMAQRADITAFFLACDPRGQHTRTGATFTQPFGAHEFLYHPTYFDWFNFANRDPDFAQRFALLLDALQPDVIHFHHYIHIGVDTIELARRLCPTAKIIVTLHEFLAICHLQGQMMTKAAAPCLESAPAKCRDCVGSHYSSGDFYLRKRYIEKFLQQADYLISPSHFLTDRYLDWSNALPPMTVIENVIAAASVPPGSPALSRSRLHLGFFGQISRLKGVDMLIETARLLRNRKSTACLTIHGDLSNQPDDYRTAFLEGVANFPANLRYVGAYEPSSVDRLMQKMDAIIVPSLWWENSPVVIQEAFRNRKPVLCADIGGMAEKVRDGLDGYHFSRNDPHSLADLIIAIEKGALDLSALCSTMQPPSDADASLSAHLALYASTTRLKTTVCTE